MSKANISFESLYYFREGNECIVKDKNFKMLFRDKKIYEKFEIPGKTDSDRINYRIQTSDTKKLAEIFSTIFNTTITEDQVNQHESNPSQPQAIKSASSPANTFKKPTTTTTTTTSQNSSSVSSTTQPVSASKSPSAPVSKTTKEPLKPNSANSFESLNYFKYNFDNTECYGVKDDQFKKKFINKHQADIVQGKTLQKEKIYLILSNDPAVIANVFTNIFETTITPEMVIEHTKKSPDSLPPPIPANKTPSTPSAVSNTTGLKPQSHQTPAFKASSTPISTTNESSTSKQEHKSIEIPHSAILLNNSQYEKLVTLLGAPNWMTNFKELHLVFDPNE